MSIESLDALRDMGVDAARGVRDESELPRRTFETTHDENSDVVTVVQCGDGIIVVTDRFEAPDRAWSGTLDDQTLLDELVADGTLVEE